MITKAIVEEIISPYKVKVRAPVLDRITSSTISTDSDSLNVATICSLPSCYPKIRVGDIVFIGFEDNTYYKAVVLGHLCKEGEHTTYTDCFFGDVTILSSAKLPKETTIGEVTSLELSCLLGVRNNIQKQLDSLKERIEILEKQQRKIDKEEVS